MAITQPEHQPAPGLEPGLEHSPEPGLEHDDAVGSPSLSPTEWVVLALLVEGPSHGFALARQLGPEADLGRIMTIRRPLVYRAIDRLVSAGLARPTAIEQGDAGPNRTVLQATRQGGEAVEQWLGTPVAHVRDLRVEFLVKLRLTERRSLDPAGLVEAQRAALGRTLAGLTNPDPDADVVDRWRFHNARAADAFLHDLAGEPAGEPAREVTGEPAGEVTGEPAGEVTGEPAGEVTGEDA